MKRTWITDPRMVIDGATPSEDVAKRVRAGDAVRVSGLGMVSCVCTQGDVSAHGKIFRIVLTSTVAKDEVYRTATGSEVVGFGPFLSDVQSLADALKAPVEVWGPGRAGQVTQAHPFFLTTVNPTT